MITTALIIIPMRGAVRDSSCSVIVAIDLERAMMPSPTRNSVSCAERVWREENLRMMRLKRLMRLIK